MLLYRVPLEEHLMVVLEAAGAVLAVALEAVAASEVVEALEAVEEALVEDSVEVVRTLALEVRVLTVVLRAMNWIRSQGIPVQKRNLKRLSKWNALAVSSPYVMAAMLSAEEGEGHIGKSSV